MPGLAGESLAEKRGVSGVGGLSKGKEYIEEGLGGRLMKGEEPA